MEFYRVKYPHSVKRASPGATHGRCGQNTIACLAFWTGLDWNCPARAVCAIDSGQASRVTPPKRPDPTTDSLDCGWAFFVRAGPWWKPPMDGCGWLWMATEFIQTRLGASHVRPQPPPVRHPSPVLPPARRPPEPNQYSLTHLLPLRFSSRNSLSSPPTTSPTQIPATPPDSCPLANFVARLSPLASSSQLAYPTQLPPVPLLRSTYNSEALS